MKKSPLSLDLVVYSHLRWDFVFQRPQHLMTRAAKERRVLFVEEPVVEDVSAPRLRVSERDCGVTVVVPVIPAHSTGSATVQVLKGLVARLIADLRGSYIAWYYTPMAMTFTRELAPEVVVYDCMDELSNFKGAPEGLADLEDELLARADVVFTGGYSLYEHKRGRHSNIHPFPSSVDVSHFIAARGAVAEPQDQRGIGRPRAGYAGVIDERLDIELIRSVAQALPHWQFVFIGPVVKIDPDVLPRAHNIHYLGGRPYTDLPAYLSGWDVGLLPFARNDATRFISPTKTPEYLAAGLPAVSTSIRDVVRGYGDAGLALIADRPAEFAAALERCLSLRGDPSWLARVDRALARTSWDDKHRQMWRLIDAAAARSYRADAAQASGTSPSFTPTGTPAVPAAQPAVPA